MKDRKEIKGMAALLALVLVLGGCGGGTGGSNQGNSGGIYTGAQNGKTASVQNAGIYDQTTGEARWTKMTDTFPSMLWGRYTYDEWTSSGTEKEPEKDDGGAYEEAGAASDPADSGQAVKYTLDYKKFYESTKFLKCSVTLDGKTVSKELSVVPIRIAGAYPLGSSKSIFEALEKKGINPYQTSWGEYFWEMPINNTWELQDWEEQVHDAYLKKFRKNDHWGDFKSLMNLNLIQMEFMTKERKIAIATFLYQVEGNQLILYEWEANPKTFEVTMNKWCTLEFCFSGRNLMLRRQGCTVAYCPSTFSKGSQNADHAFYTDGFANDVNHICEDLQGFFWHSGDESKGTICFTDGGKAVEKTVRADSEKLTLQWNKRYHSNEGKLELEENEGEMSFGYVWTEPFGVILVKDGKYYRYQHSENHYYEMDLGEGLSAEDLSKEQLEQLLREREQILTDLQKAFEEADIVVEVDPNNGKVTMDSSILFEVDQDTISAEGKDYLDRFMKVYSSVLISEKYAATISEILVEGHTDTDGSYEHNLDLSERRANYVMQYCLELCPELEGKISAKGCAYDNPVYDADGKVDKDASRRVIFRFKLRVAEAGSESKSE